MFRSDIYASISKDIANRLKNKGLISTNDDYEDIIDNADNHNFSGIFNNIGNKDIFSEIADVISNWDGNDEEISYGTNFYVCNVPNKKVHSFKNFGIYDDNSGFSCISIDSLIELRTSVRASEMRLLERIWAAIENNSQHKDALWDLIENGAANHNRFVIVTNNVAANDDEKWRLYCFGYLLYCNYNSFPKPPQLNFAQDRAFNSSLQWTLDAKYEQYFEIYDLISESHYCDDVLSRYLNMYHILENMCYRRHLTKISKGDMKRNAYVRKALSHFGKGSKAENDEIIEGIEKLFPTIDTLIPGANFTPDHKAFLEDEYNISIGPTPTPKQIAKVIYQLRNSIAHNKASELHFGFGNVADYEKIISLINLIIERLEPAIIDLLGVNPTPLTRHPLEYEKESLDLY